MVGLLVVVIVAIGIKGFFNNSIESDVENHLQSNDLSTSQALVTVSDQRVETKRDYTKPVSDMDTVVPSQELFEIDRDNLYAMLESAISEHTLQQYNPLINFLKCENASCELWVQIQVDQDESSEQGLSRVSQKINDTLASYRFKHPSLGLFVKSKRGEPNFLFVEYLIQF